MTSKETTTPPPRKLRVMVLLDEDLVPPESIKGKTREEIQRYKTEFDVISALRALGHEVHLVGVYDDLAVIRSAVFDFRPHVAFNLLEEFASSSQLAVHVMGFLELLRVPYTGCNPRGQFIAQDKSLTKKICAYHRIDVPAFSVFPIRKNISRSLKLQFPLLVKSLCEEGSVGISQASVVYDYDALVERVQFIHRKVRSAAIVEEYIEGRELYVGVIGHSRLETFPVWELVMTNLPEGVPNIATLKVKWDLKYQKKVGVATQAAQDLDGVVRSRMHHLSKRIYRLLGLSGYARLDYRLRPDGRIFLLEANPNPNIAQEEDFAMSAANIGVTYESLLQRILRLGMSYQGRYAGGQ